MIYKFTAKLRKNAGGFYTCNFLEPGIVSYIDMGCGVALLKKETIDKCLASFLSLPVIIHHQDGTPQELEPAAVGHVSDAYWNPDTGWFDCKFDITDVGAKSKIDMGYSVSCAFNVKSTAPGGEWHAIKYDEEITDLEFTHLALVPNPRYEECKIQSLQNCTVLVNSKEAVMKNGDKVPMCGRCKKNPAYFNPVFGQSQICLECIESDEAKHKKKSNAHGICPKCKKEVNTYYKDGETKCDECHSTIPNNKENQIMWFGKKKKENAQESVDPNDPAKEKFHSSQELPPDAVVDVDGEKVSIEELKKYMIAEEAEKEKMTELGLEDELEIDGKRHRVGDLVEKFKAERAAKKNAEEAEAKKEDAKAEEKPAEEKKEDSKPVEGEEAKKEDSKPAEGEPEKKEDAKENCPCGGKDGKHEASCEKQNAEGEEEKKEETIKKEDSKQNTKRDIKYFRKLNALHEKADEVKEAVVDTMRSRVDRGSDRYSSKEKKD